MRFKIALAPALALVALLSVLSFGASPALAGSGNGGEKTTYNLDDAWCFQDAELICTEIEGTFTIVVKPDGREIGTTRMRTHVVFSSDGVITAEYTTTTKMKSIYRPDGTFESTLKERTRWTDGAEVCITKIVFKIVDFDILIDRTETRCR